MNGVFAFLYTENPPQYLISPELTGIENGSTLQFLYAAYNASYPESFKVGFSTSNNAVDSFTWGEEVTTTNTSGAYYTASIPDGATYFAIQCTSNDQYVLFVTDFMIYGPTIPAGEWIEVNNVTSPYTLTGLNPETYYDWQVSGAGCTEWSAVEYFTTLEQTTQTLTVNLSTGTNYFSSCVEITLDELKAALLTALDNANGIKITSQRNGYVSWNGRAWKGSLNPFDVSQCFMIWVPSDCTITLEGSPINPAEHSLTIAHGTNWIGFPFSESMTVAAAFAGFPTRLDRISSQNSGFTSYNGTVWKGTLTSLEPGQGYLYESAATEDKPFTYPTGTSKAAQASAMPARLSVAKKQAVKTVDFDAKRVNGKPEIAKRIRK